MLCIYHHQIKNRKYTIENIKKSKYCTNDPVYLYFINPNNLNERQCSKILDRDCYYIMSPNDNFSFNDLIKKFYLTLFGEAKSNLFFGSSCSHKTSNVFIMDSTMPIDLRKDFMKIYCNLSWL